MYERFTEKAREALTIAQQGLRKFKHNQLDTEHILYGLLEQTDGLIPDLLDAMDISPAVIKGKVEESLGQSPQVEILGHGRQAQVYITPRAKRVLDLAAEEANTFIIMLCHTYSHFRLWICGVCNWRNIK